MYMTFEEAGLIVGTPEWEEKQLNNENTPATTKVTGVQAHTNMLFSCSL